MICPNYTLSLRRIFYHKNLMRPATKSKLSKQPNLIKIYKDLKPEFLA